MPTLSLCMIVKDEQGNLEVCLKGVKEFVDEIIIVDTGSTDKTLEIARKFTSKVYAFKWIDDFSAARNFSLAKATCEWILVLDADEVIKDMIKIKKIISNTDADGFFLIQRNYTNNRRRANWIEDHSKNYEGYVANPILRLFKNRKGITYKGVVHEVVDFSCKGLNIMRTNIPIYHYYEEKSSNSLEERQLNYLRIAEKSLAIKPDGRLYAEAAAVLLHFAKDYAKALMYFQKAAEMGYQKNISLEGCAECYILLKKYEEAYSVYKKMVSSGYINSTLCNNMANLLIMHKHYRPALKFLKLALEKGNQNRERIIKNIEFIERRLARL